MMKFIIEVTSTGIYRQLELNDKLYSETEIGNNAGSWTTGLCITQLMENDNLYEQYGELIDAIDVDDPMEIWYAMRNLEE